jgi:NADH-quinone oxidoreductase subunit M
VKDRLHSRDMNRMGGFWHQAPLMAGAGLFFALASLGLPGLGNFVAEILVLLGAFPVSPALTAIAALGLVAAAIYSLWLVQRVFHGEPNPGGRIPDLSRRERSVLGVLIVSLIWLGLQPQVVLNTARPALDVLQARTVHVHVAGDSAWRPGGPGARIDDSMAIRDR